MNVHQPIDERKLALQRLQMIETGDGMLLKRGRAVVKIKGVESVQIVQALLAIASDGAATKRDSARMQRRRHSRKLGRKARTTSRNQSRL